MRASSLAGAAIVLILAVAPAATAQGFAPRATVSWESRDYNGITTTQLRQDLELFLDRALAEGVSYRIGMGANHFSTDVALLEGSRKLRTVEMKPSGRLSLNLGRISSETEYRLRRSSFDTADMSRVQSNESVLSTFGWSAVPWLPDGTVRASRYRLGDERYAEDLVNDFAEIVLQRSLAGVNLSVGQGYRRQIDGRNGFSRTTGEQLAAMNWSDQFFDRRLSVSASANGALTRIDDTAAERRTRIPNPVAIARAMSGVDDTPLDSLDRPLSANPALIDGRLDVSSGISLGPGAESFQTIALDFGRISEVDRIDIVVRDERADPVLNASGIRWDVYTSIDGERWTQHPDLIDQQFDTSRSQFEISFASVDVRWIKVVSFGVAAQPVFVTEVRALYHTELVNGSRDSEYRTLMANTAITWTPLRSLTLGYSGSSYAAQHEIGGLGTSDIEDVLHSLSARYDGPFHLSYEVRWEARDATTDRYDEDSRSLLGGVRWAPRPQLLIGVSCDLRDETQMLGQVESRNCWTHLAARVLPALDITLGASDRDEERLTGSGRIDTRAYTVAANARLTRSLRLIVDGTSTHSTFTGNVEGARPPSRDDRVNATADWSAGRALALGATFGWVAGDEISGIVQRYRIRWSPFGDGSVTLQTSYHHDIDPYTNSRSERILISPRWQINRRTALTLGYTTVRTTGLYVLESESILASLSVGR